MEIITTIEEFKAKVAKIQEQEAYKKPIAFAAGRADLSQLNPDKALQMHFPVVNWRENDGSAAILIAAIQESEQIVDFTKSEQTFKLTLAILENCLNAFEPYVNDVFGDKHKNIQVLETIYTEMKTNGSRDGEFRVTFLFDDVVVESLEAAYLKLYAISLAKVELRSINLNGAFGALQNVAWSQGIPYDLDYLRINQIELQMSGDYPHIDFVDKFPRFLQHIIPADNTRILDTSKVRFGAQLAAGTTVMPGASYINFNAGTTGPVMVEGRISSSAIVGSGSDVGGGASILGVLSGTDGNPITIGENCLLGANSTCGIPLGDGCIIDAGVAILAGTKITIEPEHLAKIKEVNPDSQLKDSTVFKGKELSDLNGVHFRRRSENGQIIAKRSTREIVLNADLH